MKKIASITLFVLFLTALLHAQTQSALRPSLAVFVVGINNHQAGDYLAMLIENELGGGSRFDIITRTDAVQRKLRELRVTGQGSNINDRALIEWGRQNNLSMLCLVSMFQLDYNMFIAQLTEVKSNRLISFGDYSVSTLSSIDLKKAATELAKQLQRAPVINTVASAPPVTSAPAVTTSPVVTSTPTVTSTPVVTSTPAPAPSLTQTPTTIPIKRVDEVYNPDGIELIFVEGKSGITNIKSFYIGKYEVTQAQWKAVMGENPSFFKGDNLPVENVSWDEVQEFFARLNARTGRNYRLPTEAEWEFAASGGNALPFCPKGCAYSGSNNLDFVGWYELNSNERTHQVGTKMPNELGIYDMSGNVWEWCSDWYDSLQTARVLRGGSWVSNGASCYLVNRRNNSPGYRFSTIGFRVVLQ